VDLNTTRLDGRSATLAEVENACSTLPFLSERRLVIVEGLLARLAAPAKGKAKAVEAAIGAGAASSEEPADDEGPAPEVLKGQAKALLAYFEQVPDSTLLVLTEDDVAGGQAFRKLQDLSRDGRAKIITCEKLRRNDLPAWIRNRAQMRKVALDGPALMDLAEFVGDELRQLDQELIKLGDYARGRSVTREDVRRLVPATRVASVFDLVDALGAGNGPVAGKLMTHALDVDGEPPLRLMAMIARHYRQLLQLKALQAQGVKAPEIARTLGIFEWKMTGMVSQANRHSFARLEQALEKTLKADESIKTGKLSDREAMDVLLAELIQ
jgi:DNA polymerase III subunit delta